MVSGVYGDVVLMKPSQLDPNIAIHDDVALDFHVLIGPDMVRPTLSITVDARSKMVVEGGVKTLSPRDGRQRRNI
jgi:hypothetical protein